MRDLVVTGSVLCYMPILDRPSFAEHGIPCIDMVNCKNKGKYRGGAKMWKCLSCGTEENIYGWAKMENHTDAMRNNTRKGKQSIRMLKNQTIEC